MTTPKAMKMGEILLNAGIIDHLQLNTALKYQREWDRKLGEALVELGFISEEVLVKVLSKFLNVPSIQLTQVRANQQAIQKIPKRLAEKYGVFPVDFEGETTNSALLVAMTDPTNLNAIDEIAFSSGCKVKPVVASYSDIEKSIRRYYGEERVVDIFFSETFNPSDAIENVVNQTPFEQELKRIHSKPDSPDEMVILRKGEETTVEMDLEPSEVEEPTKPTLAMAANQPPQQAVPGADWSSFKKEFLSNERMSDPFLLGTLLQGLLKVLVDEKILSLDQISSEFRRLLSEQQNDTD